MLTFLLANMYTQRAEIRQIRSTVDDTHKLLVALTERLDDNFQLSNEQKVCWTIFSLEISLIHCLKSIIRAVAGDMLLDPTRVKFMTMNIDVDVSAQCDYLHNSSQSSPR